MTQLRDYKLYLVLGVLALVSWRLAEIFKQPEPISKVAENSPDFFSENYYKEEIDENGFIKNQLIADKMSHSKQDGQTHLQNPEMTLYNQNGAKPWVIKSETGLMAADGDHLQLQGKVNINREASDTARALTINTRDLQVQLKTNYAETEQWAEIISPPHKTSGTGMQVTFVSPIHLKLLSKVKGYYEFK